MVFLPLNLQKNFWLKVESVLVVKTHLTWKAVHLSARAWIIITTQMKLETFCVGDVIWRRVMSMTAL